MVAIVANGVVDTVLKQMHARKREKRSEGRNCCCLPAAALTAAAAAVAETLPLFCLHAAFTFSVGASAFIVVFVSIVVVAIVIVATILVVIVVVVIVIVAIVVVVPTVFIMAARSTLPMVARGAKYGVPERKASLSKEK